MLDIWIGFFWKFEILKMQKLKSIYNLKFSYKYYFYLKLIIKFLRFIKKRFNFLN